MTPTTKLLLRIIAKGSFSSRYHEDSDEVTLSNDLGFVTVKQEVFKQIVNACCDQSTWESHGMSYEMASMLGLF